MINISENIRDFIGEKTGYNLEFIIIYRHNNIRCKNLFNNLYEGSIRGFLRRGLKNER